MANTIMDLFKAETQIEIKAGELFGIMREAVKAEFLLNAVKCEVPHTYAREMATGVKEDPGRAAGDELPFPDDRLEDCTPEGVSCEDCGLRQDESGVPAAGQIIGSGSAHVRRFYEQRVEWIDIRDIIRKGHAPASLPVGTEINFKLKNGDPASVVVVGLNHYEEGDCVFWFRRIIGRHNMNDDYSNEGGFAASAMRGYLNKDVIALLPDDLAAIIVTHKTIQKIGDETIESEDRLFLMSEYEGIGDTDHSEYNGQDKQFPFFEERRNRIAYDEDGDPWWYWTADPSSVNTTNFCILHNYGGSNINGASSAGGVAPLFVIK